MASSVGEIRILANAVSFNNAWIPLDSVAFVEVSNSSNFWKVLLYSFIIGAAFSALFFWVAIDISPVEINEATKMRDYFMMKWAFLSFLHPLAPFFFGVFFTYTMFSILLALSVFLNFFQKVYVASASGGSICCIDEEGWLTTLLNRFSKSTHLHEYEAFPMRVLEAKEHYIRSLNVPRL